MEIWLWTAVALLTLVIGTLLVKIHLLQKAAREIEGAFTDRLVTESNTLIRISTGDKHMRKLANSINTQLRKLREERRRFQQGDMDLKNAVTNISHDLRTPLTAICGYLDLLEQEEKTESVSRYVEIIRNRTEMLTTLTEELFQYSVILTTQSNTTKEPVTINRVLEESIAAFYTDLKKHGITPTIQMPKSKVIRTLDHSALSRVFSNLLNNAIKYSDGDLDITLLNTGQVIFTNTAAGLNALQLGRLFDRFYTVEAAKESTGLGLTIARTLIEQMNGTISVQYQNNRLSIYILFPDAPI